MQAFEHLCRSSLWNTQPAISCYIYVFSSFIADKNSSRTQMSAESAWQSNGLFALVYLLISPSSPAVFSVLSLGVSFLIFYNLLLLCPSLSQSFFSHSFPGSDVSGGETCWADPQFRGGFEAEGELTTQTQHTAAQQRHAVSATTQPWLP